MSQDGLYSLLLTVIITSGKDKSLYIPFLIIEINIKIIEEIFGGKK
jgi:hypothetical protein